MEKLKTIMYPFLQKSKKFFYVILYRLYLLMFQSNPKRILIASNTKEELYGNLLYIYQELQNYDYTIQILTMKEGNFWKKINYNLKLIYYVAISKYILIDDFFPLIYVLKIRKDSKLIQVWHALGAYKKVGYSRNDTR